jgi:hypothetical protein
VAVIVAPSNDMESKIMNLEKKQKKLKELDEMADELANCLIDFTQQLMRDELTNDGWDVIMNTSNPKSNSFSEEIQELCQIVVDAKNVSTVLDEHYGNMQRQLEKINERSQAYK